MEISNESNGVKRKYFVAFTYWNADDTYGFASRAIEREFSVSDWDDILDISNYILSCNPDMKKIVISSWQKFEDPE
jgi:hypothetical protein